MADDDILAQFKTNIEKRIREQLARHHRVDSAIDPRQVVDIQIGQEREMLERKVEKLEKEGKDELAEVMSLLIDWLPQLARDLKLR